MIELQDIRAHAIDQERGEWFELPDPVTGKGTGIRLRIAGPDSETQRKARLALADALAQVADDEGRVTPEHRETARLESLARCVLDWELGEDGERLQCTFPAVLRFLRAATWVQVAVDNMAGLRKPLKGGA